MDILEEIEINIEALDKKKNTGELYHNHPRIGNNFLNSRDFALLTILRAQRHIILLLKKQRR